MGQPTPHPAERLGESETRNADLRMWGLRRPRRNWRRGAWRCGTRLNHLPPVQRSVAIDDADIPLVDKSVTVDDSDLSRAGKRNDPALFERGQAAAHGFDGERKIIGHVVARKRQYQGNGRAVSDTPLHQQQEASDLLFRRGSPED